MLEECLQDGQALRPWDRNPHKLLRYARAIVELSHDVKKGADLDNRTSFSPEIGMCGILFLLAHRTADPDIRAQALHLACYFNRLEGVRDLYNAFKCWLLQPHPKPSFRFMLGEPGY